MIEFIDSGLYFVQDENNFINPLLQVGSGSAEKSTGSGGPKINGSDRIQILIPSQYCVQLFLSCYLKLLGIRYIVCFWEISHVIHLALLITNIFYLNIL